ncbi:hypothetical protein M758_1G283000 [Ceratodon purpureus]|nr:hypothetical protein M758_1G283000 [Ceratodon purpureus]
MPFEQGASSGQYRCNRRVTGRLTLWLRVANMAIHSSGYGESSLQGMDARLWGRLQDHIDLTMVYAKLPIGAFFRLRQVCKEWNRLASDQGFLQESFPHPIPQPYFVVGDRNTEMHRLFRCPKVGHRLLTYEVSSRRWNWSRLPFHLFKCEVAGLLYDSYSNCVFNAHTRVFHELPPLPEPPPNPLVEDEHFLEPLVGMTVDTSVSPYSFQVILGHEDVGTRIYDSKSSSWTQKPSTLVVDARSVEESELKPTCAQCNGFLYFRVWGEYSVNLHIYNLEKDEWNCGPPSIPDAIYLFCDIGVWQERLFLFRMKAESSSTVWALELANHSENSWTLFDWMPDELCSWMLAGEEDNLYNSEKIEMQCIFCGEYVLLYSCVKKMRQLEDVKDRAVLYNLDRKMFEKVELPGPVSSKTDVRIALRDARLKKKPGSYFEESWRLFRMWNGRIMSDFSASTNSF